MKAHWTTTDGVKLGSYAVAGVADYWIINLVDSQLEVYRALFEDAGSTLGCPYSSCIILDPSDAIAPLAAPNAPVAVADLLP
jgi:Uma2 family endonuclease